MHCYECDFHDHDGATGYCNKFKTWTNMSFSCEDNELNYFDMDYTVDDDGKITITGVSKIV
ncbi:MAG: hypothetical protein KBT27_05485 [Prevotellaceae bacterium]|nr:hypothetical protein [Candidatus Faecinaster equi]